MRRHQTLYQPLVMGKGTKRNQDSSKSKGPWTQLKACAETLLGKNKPWKEKLMNQTGCAGNEA